MSNWGSEPLDIFERALGIIANASGGDWSKESEEWREAAESFRDDYHQALNVHVLEEKVRELTEELRVLNTPCRDYSIGRVILDVVSERIKQDDKWGGAEHDDKHTDSEWSWFRRIRENRIISNGDRSFYNRDDLVEIAALAVAQIEAFDRYHDILDCKARM